MGRHKQEPVGLSASELAQLTRKDQWVWVEGRELIPFYAEDKHIAMDKAKIELAKLGLTLHTQNGEAPANTPLRRKWTSQRMDLSLAAEILDDHPEGITIEAYANELFDKEPGWTVAHQKATVAKTYVIVHKLKGMGLATRSRKGLLFPTRSQSKKGMPPILLTVVRSYLAERGEEWPEKTVRQLVKLILDANEAVAVGKAAAVAHQ